MSAAHVIDLESFRQQRKAQVPPPVSPAARFAWQPVWVWFWVPVR